MSGTTPHREVEIKLRVPSAEDARRLLRAAGFRVVRERVHESNVVYDTEEGSLRRTGRLLRVREAGSRVLLTYKGPAENATHKSREEIEVSVSDRGAFCLVLERLGMMPSFLYEKYRTEFRQPGIDGFATVDETPIGDYIELEGDAAWIDRTAAELGFRQRDYITASYASLYFKKEGMPTSIPAYMLFGDARE